MTIPYRCPAATGCQRSDGRCLALGRWAIAPCQLCVSNSPSIRVGVICESPLNSGPQAPAHFHAGLGRVGTCRPSQPLRPRSTGETGAPPRNASAERSVRGRPPSTSTGRRCRQCCCSGALPEYSAKDSGSCPCAHLRQTMTRCISGQRVQSFPRRRVAQARPDRPLVWPRRPHQTTGLAALKSYLARQIRRCRRRCGTLTQTAVCVGAG